MYLKSIEIHGFKSFANKIVFDFHNGITGIVGPNGSGKSNVADAVRWVLGEQSAKQLRGSSMQDVIFAGTENRKPMSYAYVAITLDNSDHQLDIDYDQVTIGRRVYRSGESEYLINGNVSRLKEVHELFYDTGIGKEGYSIIGQGQIDRILSGKPEERRELFDEAAGIVKFKKRKLTAQKKLDNERENLVRVNDILLELERQVGPLERQAQKARTYLQKREELKDFDVNLFLMDADRIHEKQRDGSEKQAIADAQMAETQTEYEAIRQGYEKLGEDINHIEEQIESIRRERSESATNRQKLEAQIGICQEQVHTAEMTAEHLVTRRQSIRQELEERKNAGDAYLEQKSALEQQLQELEEESRQANAALARVQLEAEAGNRTIEEAQTQLIALLNDRTGIGARKQRAGTLLEQNNIRKAQLTRRLLERKSKGEDYESIVESYRKELNSTEQRIRKLQDRTTELEKKDLDWKQKIRENNRRQEETSTLYHKQESRLESLRGIAERYDGYGNSIRRVMEQKKYNKGILGVVSDLIHVEKKYETAIETALGGSIQNIVTRDEDTAKEMIRFLKENRYGRATFLPLTSVTARNNPKNDAALKEEGALGLASQLVECDSMYREITAYLLGRVLVVDTLDHATRIAGRYHYGLHIVTLEGEYLNPGGSMTGGAFKNTSNLLARNREIAELEKKRKETAALLTEIRSRRDDLSTAHALCEEELEELRGKLQEEYIIRNTEQLSVEQALQQQKESRSAYDGLMQESRDVEDAIADITESLKQIETELEESDRLQQEIEAKGNEAQRALEAITERQQEAAEAQQKIQLLITEQSKTLEFNRENLERIEGENRRLKEEADGLELQLQQAAEDARSKNEEIEQIRHTLEGASTYNERLSRQLEEAVQQRDEMNREYRTYFTKQEEIAERKNQLDKELFRLNSQLERLKEEEESRTSYMWIEYELTPHAAEAYRDEELGSYQEIRTRVTNIKDEIKKLGDVNVNAIEQFREVNERYTFLKDQHEDLIRAEQTLVDIIKELDEGMRRQFNEKFAQIQVEYDKAFRQLFGGGHGRLELVEGEDILECGIRIISQPPGKKLQNMMQLSGGEKALSAIALLFAIQALKPSPFCLLDEIEAALDDSNVDRYANYLNKLTGDTQFIVITHRRGTMAAADRLYGITMQEKGVSTLVSVNLIDEDLA